MSDFVSKLRHGLSAWDAGNVAAISAFAADSFAKDSAASLLVAVSGGADSVALLLGLHQLQPEFGVGLQAVHVNHQLRGEESQQDEDFVRQLCDTLSVRLTVCSGPLNENDGIEETARRIRYEHFREVAKFEAAKFIALAHTADDQAETILHHILRGTGPAGLRGIPPTRVLDDDNGVRVIRPMLSITREEIVAWLKHRNQNFREDSSNTSPAFTRNRIRHQLLPLLERDFNQQVRSALRRLSDQVSEQQTAIQFAVAQLLDASVLECQPGICRLDRAVLSAAPRHLVRQCFVEIWTRNHWPRKRMTFAHWNTLADIVEETTPATSLPGGLHARNRNAMIVIETQSAD